MPNEAGAILAHYLKQLALRSELRWTEHNDRDMTRLAQLLGSGDAAPTDSIPPFQPAERTTVVLSREDTPPVDPRFEQWKHQRRDEEREAVDRMMSRNGRGGGR